MKNKRHFYTAIVVVTFIVFFSFVLACGNSSPKETEEYSVEYQLAVINESGHVEEDDLVVKEFKTLVDSINNKVIEEPTEIGDILVTAQEILWNKYKIRISLLELTKNLNQSVPDDIPVLNANEASRLLSIPNPRYPTGIRNLAIITVMLNLGLRVSEVSNLKPGNINLTEGKLRVVNGKGGVDRDLIIPKGYTSEILKKWKSIKPKGKYFFTTLKRRKVSSRYIHLFVKRYAFRANIDKNVSPHTLRHTFATEFYRQTRDLETLRMILGHSNVSTT